MLFKSADQLRIRRRHQISGCPAITEFEPVADGVTVFLMAKRPTPAEKPSRTLLRHALNLCYGGDAPEWVFAESAYGQPMLERSDASTPYNFSSAATDDLLVAAIAKSGKVGIDVETVDRIAINATIGDRWLADCERRAMAALDGDALVAELACRWVMKEAYGKARGIGLRFPLADLAFVNDAGSISGCASSKSEAASVAGFAFWLFRYEALLLGLARTAT